MLNKNRKFFLFSVITVGSFLLCAFDKITGAELAQILVFVVPFFSGANALEHMSKAWAERGGKQNANAVVNPP